MPIKNRKFIPRPKPLNKYLGDARDTILDRARKTYRKNKEGFELTSCLRSLNYFEEQAIHGPVTLTRLGIENKIVTIPYYKVTDVAELLEKSYQTFWRWTEDPKREAIVPPPIFDTTGSGRIIKVYHRSEVRALITIIGEHERDFAYYRADHIDTRKRLFAAITTIRNQLKKEYSNAPQEASRTPVRRRPVKGGIRLPHGR